MAILIICSWHVQIVLYPYIYNEIIIKVMLVYIYIISYVTFVCICKRYLKQNLRNFLLYSIILIIVFMLHFKSLGLFILQYWNFELFYQNLTFPYSGNTILSLCISLLEDCVYKRGPFISVSGFCHLAWCTTWNVFNEREGTDSDIKEMGETNKQTQEPTGKTVREMVPLVEIQISLRQKRKRPFKEVSSEEGVRRSVFQWT